MARYNGYHSWSEHNVCSWLNEHELLRDQMMHCLKVSTNKEQAARMLIKLLPSKTADGAKYSLRSIRKAMVGLECGGGK